MRLSFALLAVAGCAVTPPRYDTMLGELRRDDRAQQDAGTRLSALVSGPQLDRRALVAATLAENGDLEEAREAWRAAAAEVPAASALDDPTARYEFAPLSVGSSSVPYGQRIELAQKLPFPGKRALAGDAALADAETRLADYRSARLAVAELASQLYDDLYLNARALEVNAENRALLDRMKQVATARVASGRGSTQDALEAEVELAHVEHERVMLVSDTTRIVARINGLLHRDPSAELPPPPAQLDPPAMPADAAALERTAVADRPEQAAAAARLRGDSARAELAHRAYYPDFELMASYDSMWAMPQHRWMLGIGLDVPLQRGRRAAAVEAAEDRVAGAQAALAQSAANIRAEVARARADLVESLHVVHLYDARLAPAARAELEAALAGFTAGTNDFPTVITAARGLREIEIGGFRARAEAWQRRAALDRVTGQLAEEAAP